MYVQPDRCASGSLKLWSRRGVADVPESPCNGPCPVSKPAAPPRLACWIMIATWWRCIRRTSLSLATQSAAGSGSGSGSGVSPCETMRTSPSPTAQAGTALIFDLRSPGSYTYSLSLTSLGGSLVKFRRSWLAAKVGTSVTPSGHIRRLLTAAPPAPSARSPSSLEQHRPRGPCSSASTTPQSWSSSHASYIMTLCNLTKTRTAASWWMCCTGCR